MVNKMNTNSKSWSPVQIYAARYLFKLERIIHANRAEYDEHVCADVIENLKNVYREMESQAFPNKGFNCRWYLHMPLHLYIDFSKDEIDLLKDIEEWGTEQLRYIDSLYWELSHKKAISISHQYNKYTISLTERGKNLLNYMKEQGV